MKFLALLSLACVFCVALAAPIEEEEGVKTGSCADNFTLSAAGLAIQEINKDRKEGYVLALHRLANVNQMIHAETGVVFYLLMDVVETDCHVLSKKDSKSCRLRGSEAVYGQCRAAIYINRPQRIVRLYKYKCLIRPVSPAQVVAICPDCPTSMDKTSANIVKAVSLSLDKFNKESGLANRFNLLEVTRAVSQGGILEYYGAEYLIQESSCANNDTTTEKCPPMDCEFAHKGFCKGSLYIQEDETVEVECEIYEPETAEEQKKMHLLGGESDHSHAEAAEPHDHTHAHDHAQDHTKGRAQAGHVHGAGHSHAGKHTHEDGTTHDHVHAHHAAAHDHTADRPNQHHKYEHAAAHTHDHDHDLALDHDHKHQHLHEHEHHHHHHHPEQANAKPHHHPEGMVIMLPSMDMPTIFPTAGVPLPAVPKGEGEPTIVPFPKAVAADCPSMPNPEATNALVNKAFAADPEFKVVAE
ncbi:unnamed protein product [Merluccius merluccius]